MKQKIQGCHGRSKYETLCDWFGLIFSTGLLDFLYVLSMLIYWIWYFAESLAFTAIPVSICNFCSVLFFILTLFLLLYMSFVQFGYAFCFVEVAPLAFDVALFASTSLLIGLIILLFGNIHLIFFFWGHSFDIWDHIVVRSVTKVRFTSHFHQRL